MERNEDEIERKAFDIHMQMLAFHDLWCDSLEIDDWAKAVIFSVAAALKTKDNNRPDLDDFWDNVMATVKKMNNDNLSNRESLT